MGVLSSCAGPGDVSASPGALDLHTTLGARPDGSAAGCDDASLMADRRSVDTRLAKALSHPLRSRLLMAYTGRVASPSQVAEELGAPLGDVSYHTKRLVEQGCVELVEAVRGRGGVKHFYRATVPYEVRDEAWEGLAPALR